MELKREFVLREIAGDTLLIPTGRTALDLNGMLTLNESGALLWRALEQGADRRALTQALTDEYEVEPAQAERDVDEFLRTLSEAGCLE